MIIVHDIFREQYRKMVIQNELEEKKILQLIVSASEEFLQSAGNKLNYQKITDNILDISGAKYAGFNLYDEDGDKFRTVAFSAPDGIVKKASSLVGFKFLDKSWEHDPARAEKIKSKIITRFSSLSELEGGSVYKHMSSLLEKTFDFGEVVIVKILKENVMLGDFTLIMPRDVNFKNDSYVEIYTRQIGLLIVRNRGEARMIENESRLRSVFAAVSDPIFLFDQKTGAILDVNNAACRLYGYTRDEMLKLNAGNMSAEPKITKESMNNSFTTFVPVRYHKKKDGTVFVVEITASLFELNGRNAITASMRDITERKAAEDLLRNERERLANIIEGTNVGTWEWNVQTGETIYNERWAEIVGHTLDEIPSVCLEIWKNFAHPEDLKKSNEQLNRVFSRELDYYDIEMRIKHKDGNWVWIHDRGKVISWTPDGKPLWMRGTYTEITERKKTEEALRESELKYRSIIESSSDAIFCVDEKGQYKFTNHLFSSTFGKTPDYFIGKTFWDIYPKEHADYRYDATKKVFQTGESESLEVEVPLPDKTLHFLAIANPIKDETGKVILVLTHAVDITERKRTEELVQKSEIKYRQLFDNMTTGFALHEMIYDEEGNPVNYRFLEVNSAFEKLTGLKASALIGKTVKDVIPNTEQYWIDAYSTVSKTGESISFQNYSEGLKKWYESWVFSPAKNQFATIFSDITERKKTEEEIIHLSFHDHLTGLYNRRFFEEELKRLDTERQLPLSFIMGDLNGLKVINDVFGHDEGDRLLKETAEILKTVCRSDDILARWGGDEFVILLPKTSISEADEITGRIKKECKKTNTQKIELSLSLGSATKEIAGQNIQTILIDAESNMYRNKLGEKQSLASSVIFALDQALYEKSNETKEHTDRIHELALKLGRSIKLPSHQLDELSLLASLHDIGKVAIPEKILLKKGKLTEKEWDIIKRHPEIGFNIAQSSPQIAHIAKSILSCHENFDGSGYPMGLKGQAIPIISRIIFIIDSYDVMISGRVYKPAMSKEDAIKELKRCAGSQFDPELVNNCYNDSERLTFG